MKDVNLETIIERQSWCKTWPPNGSISVQKQKLHKKPREACKSSWSPTGNLKSFILTNPWNLTRPVKIFPGIIVRQHHTDQKQMRAVRRVKEGTSAECRNQVWMKIGGQILWNATLCEIQIGRIHFHPKSISSTDTSIQKSFHPILTLSSKRSFIQ